MKQVNNQRGMSEIKSAWELLCVITTLLVYYT